jgi:deoxyribodipyrimidine photolyase
LSLLFDVTATPEYAWLTQGGAIGVLAAVVWAFMTGRIVTGRQYQQVLAERDKALDQNLKLNEVAQRTLEAALRKVG